MIIVAGNGRDVALPGFTEEGELLPQRRQGLRNQLILSNKNTAVVAGFNSSSITTPASARNSGPEGLNRLDFFTDFYPV
jgi:hypothetical protein